MLESWSFFSFEFFPLCGISVAMTYTEILHILNGIGIHIEKLLNFVFFYLRKHKDKYQIPSRDVKIQNIEVLAILS